MSHDYSHHSQNEDPRMLAFFDSLVQREIEGSSSVDSDSDESTKVTHGGPTDSSGDESSRLSALASAVLMSANGDNFSSDAVVNLDARLLSSNLSSMSGNQTSSRISNRLGRKTIAALIAKKRNQANKAKKRARSASAGILRGHDMKRRRRRRFQFSDESSDSDGEIRTSGGCVMNASRVRTATRQPLEVGAGSREDRAGLSAAEVAAVFKSRNKTTPSDKQKSLLKVRSRLLQDLSDSDSEVVHPGSLCDPVNKSVTECVNPTTNTSCIAGNSSSSSTSACKCAFCQTVGAYIKSPRSEEAYESSSVLPYSPSVSAAISTLECNTNAVAETSEPLAGTSKNTNHDEHMCGGTHESHHCQCVMQLARDVTDSTGSKLESVIGLNLSARTVSGSKNGWKSSSFVKVPNDSDCSNNDITCSTGTVCSDGPSFEENKMAPTQTEEVCNGIDCPSTSAVNSMNGAKPGEDCKYVSVNQKQCSSINVDNSEGQHINITEDNPLSGVNDMQSATDEQPNLSWTKFHRFRNRLESGRQQYREQSTSDEVDFWDPFF